MQPTDTDTGSLVRRAGARAAVGHLYHLHSDGELAARLTGHLAAKARGCFLYIKLILDLLEKGSLSIKSASFKVLPQTLSEIYQLVFNQRFSSVQAYDQVGVNLNYGDFNDRFNDSFNLFILAGYGHPLHQPRLPSGRQPGGAFHHLLGPLRLLGG